MYRYLHDFVLQSDFLLVPTLRSRLAVSPHACTQPFKWMYDRGSLENMKEVLGQAVWTWLIPTPVTGDGLRWRTSSLTPMLAEA